MRYIILPFLITFILSLAFVLVKRSKYLIHMLQLEGYKNNEFKKWMDNFREKVFDTKLRLSSVASLSSVTAITIFSVVERKQLVWQTVIVWASLTIFSTRLRKSKEKKGLVYTDRVKRLFTTHIIVNIGLVMIINTIIIRVAINSNIEGVQRIAVATLLVSGTAINWLQPFILMLSNNINKPIEASINRKFFNMAKNKLRKMEKMKKVGITGSYGKTSVKFFTDTILSEKYNTLKTPESYNTPMGVSKVINQDLDDSYDIFISEMGARNIGDIAEMAELIGHSIGVITSVGPAHIDTFKTIENIAKTKYEIIDKLSDDGIAIFNYDNKYVKELADKTSRKKIVYGLENINEVDIYAKDIKVSEIGSEFILGLKSGEEIKCKTNILGKHNIQNILAGASVGIAMEMSLEEIAKGISKIEAVPHRLQLINPGTGVIIIDDAFNSNPDGAKAALEVLSGFETGRKIIITPGMVELGEMEKQEHRKFGINIGEVCDFAILIGKKRTIDIKEGILTTDFNGDNLYVVNRLDDAVKLLQGITKPKDVVLFENDLPDNFNE